MIQRVVALILQHAESPRVHKYATFTSPHALDVRQGVVARAVWPGVDARAMPKSNVPADVATEAIAVGKHQTMVSGKRRNIPCDFLGFESRSVHKNESPALRPAPHSARRRDRRYATSADFKRKVSLAGHSAAFPV